MFQNSRFLNMNPNANPRLARDQWYILIVHVPISLMTSELI